MDARTDEEDSLDVIPCRVCGRTFVSASLKKHEKICEKNVVKRRKPFDSFKQRVEGTDIAQFHRTTYLKRPEPVAVPEKKKKRSWKEKHLELLSSIRAAKGISPDKETMPYTKSSSLLADTKRCPSCDRQFGPKAYDRHVEWCKEKHAHQRLHHSPANVILAKERLEARLKYVPPLNRAKKLPVKEKYSSPASTRTESTTSLVSQSSVRAKDKKTYLERKKAEAEKKKETKGSLNKPEEVKRNDSMMAISSPSLTSDSMKSQDATDPYNIAHQQLMELLSCDDFRSITPSPQNTSHGDTIPFETQKDLTPLQTLAISSTHIKPIKDSLVEFELLESLIEKNLKKDKSAVCSLNGTLTADDTTLIDPCLINENDNLALPEDFLLEGDSPTSQDWHFVVGVQKQELYLTPEPPNKPKNVYIITSTPKATKKTITNVSSTKPSSKRPLTVNNPKNRKPLTRSVSSVSSEKSVCSEKEKSSPKKEPTKTTKNVKTNHLKQEETIDKWLQESNEKNSLEPPFKPEELFNVDDSMYEEFKKYEEMYMKERKQTGSSKKSKTKMIDLNYKILTPGEEQANANKLSIDSAYGSLTRSAPDHVAKTLTLPQLELNLVDNPVIDEYVQSSSPSPTLPKNQQLAKFCHECGNRYPVVTAKFCIECGVRRLIL